MKKILVIIFLLFSSACYGEGVVPYISPFIFQSVTSTTPTAPAFAYTDVAGLKLYVEAYKDTAYANGNNVPTMDNLVSANGLYQPTVGNQGLFYTPTFNSKAAYWFDGNDNWNYDNSFNFPTAVTWVGVFKIRVTSGATCPAGWSTSTVPLWRLQIEADGTLELYEATNTSTARRLWAATNKLTDNQLYTITITQSDRNVTPSIYINAASETVLKTVASGTVGTITNSNYSLGRPGASTSLYSPVTFCLNLVYNNVVSAADLAKIHAKAKSDYAHY